MKHLIKYLLILMTVVFAYNAAVSSAQADRYDLTENAVLSAEETGSLDTKNDHHLFADTHSDILLPNQQCSESNNSRSFRTGPNIPSIVCHVLKHHIENPGDVSGNYHNERLAQQSYHRIHSDLTLSYVYKLRRILI